jgi:hypothetical protein
MGLKPQTARLPCMFGSLFCSILGVPKYASKRKLFCLLFIFGGLHPPDVCRKRGEIRMKGGKRENTAAVSVNKTQ